MVPPNETLMTYFIINGISDLPELQAPIFLLVLIIYLATLGGNMTILVLVCLDSQLQTPMYFFLCNLSTMDVFSTTITLHKIIIVFMTRDNSIAYVGCMAQMFIFLSLECDELLILTAMSYDRFVAICNPLRYPTVMNHRVCTLLTTICWALGFLETTPHLWMISGFSCFKTNVVNHFFCDIVPLMQITCNNTLVLEMYTLFVGVFLVGLLPSVLTIISYIFIINTVIGIRSSIGRNKAFYTCYSHLTVVVLLYATLFGQYTRPTSKDSMDSKKLLALFNTAAVPLLNPLIYSLKNKDVKSALRRRLNYGKNPV